MGGAWGSLPRIANDRAGGTYDRGRGTYDRGGGTYDRGRCTYDRGRGTYDRAGGCYDREMRSGGLAHRSTKTQAAGLGSLFLLDVFLNTDATPSVGMSTGTDAPSARASSNAPFIKRIS